MKTEEFVEAIGATETAREPEIDHLTERERAARGRAARSDVPRSTQAALDLARGRDPVAILDADSPNRAPELVPIRYGRMLVSPFTFYRGSAAVMAHDLAGTPSSGLVVQLCGDAHLANFGGYGSPERALVFDVNDFDETHRGPFEWDVKRLASSFEIAGRHRGFSDSKRRAALMAVLGAYRDAMREFATMGNLDVWYARLDADMLEAELRREREKKAASKVARGAEKGYTKNSLKALAKLTHEVDGELRIVSDPPLVVPIEEMIDGDQAAVAAERIRELLSAYRRTLPSDRRRLLEGFRLIHIARKVVGVGSVGTRCFIALMVGRDNADPLFLQIKEAGPSVLEPFLGRSPYKNHGRRVVEGQRLMQASSDILLGWVHVDAGLDGKPRDFYVRQLWDWKTSADLETMLPGALLVYARICGWTLASAHARSGDRIAIGSYLGSGDRFDRAVAEFATTYADLNERDYEALLAAKRSGRIAADEGT